MKFMRDLVENKWFQLAILMVIVFNGILFGLQTSPKVVTFCGSWLSRLDSVCLAIFVVELVLKMLVYNRRFLCDGWNIFDFVIVALSFMPDCGMFSAARIFRVLRVFKLVSGVRQMRVILSAILKAVPGIMWSGSLLLMIYYVYGIIGTTLFGEKFPDWFGSLGASLYSLFQVMTLESWSMGISRPVMEVYPYAWVFFVSYILFTSFVVMNVVVGIVLNSISDSSQDEREKERRKAEEEAAKTRRQDLETEIEKLKKQLEVVENLLKRTRPDA